MFNIELIRTKKVTAENRDVLFNRYLCVSGALLLCYSCNVCVRFQVNYKISQLNYDLEDMHSLVNKVSLNNRSKRPTAV